MPDNANILALLASFRDALIQKDAASISRMITAYVGIKTRIDKDIDALVLEIQNMEDPTIGKVRKLQRYTQLRKDVESELRKYSGYVGVELDTLGREAVELGGANASALIKASLREIGITAPVPVNRLNNQAVEALLGFLDPSGPLYKRLELLAPAVADGVAQTIMDGIALGFNPNKIGREITRVFGIGLTDSMRMARTVNLWAYRESNRATYAANPDVVTGWQWVTAFDDRTCMSCINMHGSIHPIEEPLNDHHNGRCSPAPVVLGIAPIDGTGYDWFTQQDEATQRSLMGSSMYDAWIDGQFDFSNLSATREDDVYGEMRHQASLKQLIGG